MQKKKLNLLIVEDRQDDADLVVLELKASGYETTWKRVQTKNDYLEHLTPDIDVILADYNLPQFSAPEALRLLQVANMDTPFIVLTGSISEEVAVACMKQGANDYLLKDRLSRLGEAVRHGMEQRNLRRAQEQAERDLLIKDRAIDTSINGVVLTDMHGYITYCNQAFANLWEIGAPERLVGQSISKFQWVEEDGQALVAGLRQNDSAQGEVRSKKANGEPLIVQYTASLVTDGAGKPLCYMGIFIDITEQKQAEHARQEAEILKIELEKERELRDLKSRFVSMIVHDFRNPLTTLQIILNLLHRYPEKIDPEMHAEKLAQMISQTEHMNQLIDDVLMIGQMDNVNLDFDPQYGDIGEFCYTIFQDFAQSGEKTGFNYKFSGRNSNCPAYFDPNLLLRALSNLFSNAVKYSPEGGTINLSVERETDFVSITLSDEGIGIPSEDIDKLFDGFYRARNVGTIKGTGLGLAIVKQIVDLHEGEILVTTHPEQGTTFTLKIPAKPVALARDALKKRLLD